MPRWFYDEVRKHKSSTVRLYQHGGSLVAIGYMTSDPSVNIKHTWGTEKTLIGALKDGFVAGKETVHGVTKEARSYIGEGNPNVGNNLNRVPLYESTFHKKYSGSSIEIPITVDFPFLSSSESESQKADIKNLLEVLVGDIVKEGGSYYQQPPNGFFVQAASFESPTKGLFDVSVGESMNFTNLVPATIEIKTSRVFTTTGDPLLVLVSVSFEPAFLFKKADVLSIYS